MKSKRTFGIVTAFVIVLALQLIHPILAQENYYGILLDPALIHLPVTPGESYAETINLTNDFQHGEKVTYYPSVSLFQQADETGNAEFYKEEDLPDYADASSWVTFDQDKYEISYGETVESNITINIPNNASAGGHYIALIYSDNQDSDNTEDQHKTVQLSSAISSLIFITVPGDTIETGELIEFKTSKFLYEAPPVEFQIRYKNSGDIHTNIGGNIFVYKEDILNSIQNIAVNSDAGLTLPGNTRQYDESFTDGALYLEDGKFKLNRELLPKIYFGEYTATLKLRHTVNDERVTEDFNVTFWIIPWRLIITAFAIIIVIVIFSKIVKPQKEVPIIKPINSNDS